MQVSWPLGISSGHNFGCKIKKLTLAFLSMQHWHVYTRHNKNLFEEILVAYRQGRCAANPAEFWYEGMSFGD